MTKNKRPLIGIACSYNGEYERGKLLVSGEYLGALWDAGAIPVLLKWQNATTPEGYAAIKEYAHTFDGFLFSGGVDLDPIYYGEQVCHERVCIHKERDDFELALFKEVYEGTDKPLLGICRGEQLINVALGGSLYQHIEGHSQDKPSYELTQTVEPIDGTLLSRLADGAESIRVNTFHHQAVKELAPCLRLSARGEDGIIEAYESLDPEKRFILAVQWHPELFYKLESHGRAVFAAFTDACRKKM